MTDRERLLGMVKEQEMAAASFETMIRGYLYMGGSDPISAQYATRAAHHALTAMALREAIETLDRCHAYGL